MKRFIFTLVLSFAFTLSVAQAQWTSIGGQGKDVSVQGNTPWTIGSDSGIYSHTGGGWQQYPGGGRGLAIDVGANGIPWVIGTDNGIYRGTGSGWVQHPGGGRGKDIAVDGMGRPWVIGMNDGIHYHDGSRWVEYPGGGRGLAVSVTSAGMPLVIGVDNAIYRGTGSGWAQIPGGGRGKDIAVDQFGYAWVIGMDNRIYRHDGSRWTEHPGGGLGHRIAIYQPGAPYVIGMDSAIWRYAAAPGPPPPFSDNLTGRWNCDDGGTYFLRHMGNVLWWYGRSPDGGATWSNVFHGRVEGNQITGNWADVPQGNNLNHGDMTLQVVSSKNLRVVSRTGGFGGSEWSRIGR